MPRKKQNDNGLGSLLVYLLLTGILFVGAIYLNLHVNSKDVLWDRIDNQHK